MAAEDFRGGLDKFDFAWRAALIFMETSLLRQYPIFYRQTFSFDTSPLVRKRWQICSRSARITGDLPRVKLSLPIKRIWYELQFNSTPRNEDFQIGVKRVREIMEINFGRLTRKDWSGENLGELSSNWNYLANEIAFCFVLV